MDLFNVEVFHVILNILTDVNFNLGLQIILNGPSFINYLPEKNQANFILKYIYKPALF